MGMVHNSSSSLSGDPVNGENRPGDNRPPSRRAANSEESALVRFAREYGWRAYAIPVLAVITLWVFVDILGGDTPTSAADGVEETYEEPEPSISESRGPGPNPADMDTSNLPNLELPDGGPFAATGDGTYRAIGTPGASAGEGQELTMTYSIEVENGVDTTTYGGDDAVAAMIDATLTDPRGWSNDPRFRLEHIARDEDPELLIQLTSTETTKKMCGSEDFDLETSCRTTAGGGNTVVLNVSRWARGAYPFEGDLGSYRQYLINHEVGHALGYAAHVPCIANGELAPIMMQQTLSLDNSELHAMAPHEVYPDDGAQCRYNPWPYPVPNADVDRPGEG